MLEKIDTFELDALKELGNMGAGHAATSLSQLLGRYIDMSVPEVKIIKTENLDKEFNFSNNISGVLTTIQDIEGEEEGYLYTIFTEDSREKITKMLLGSEESNDMQNSAIMEIGNILSSSFCNALGEFLEIVLIPGIPQLKTGKLADIVDFAVKDVGRESGRIIIFENQLKESEEAIDVYLMLIPNNNFFEKIIKIVKEKIV